MSIKYFYADIPLSFQISCHLTLIIKYADYSDQFEPYPWQGWSGFAIILRLCLALLNRAD